MVPFVGELVKLGTKVSSVATSSRSKATLYQLPYANFPDSIVGEDETVRALPFSDICTTLFSGSKSDGHVQSREVLRSPKCTY